MVRCAAAMEAGQVAEGRALAVVAAAPAPARGGGARTEPAGLPCPRCESTDTKFCYYNNYNLSQPRHFCKGCRRYWTRGGALRNVPVGGGTRKASPTGRRKRNGPAALAPSPAQASPAPLSVSAPYGTLRPYDLSSASALASPLAAVDLDRRLLDLGGSFSSLLTPAPAPDRHFSAGFLMGGLAPAVSPASAPPALPLQQQPVSQALPEGLIFTMWWPDLSI